MSIRNFNEETLTAEVLRRIEGEIATVYGTLEKMETSRTFRGHVPQATGRIVDATRTLYLTRFSQPYIAAYGVMWEAGQRERALQILERWISRHPEDPGARALLEGRRRELRMNPGPMPVAPPTMPNLP